MPDVPARPKPAITRLWIALQKMDQLRVEFERATDPACRLAAASSIYGVADEVRGLTAEVLADAGQNRATAVRRPGQ